MKWTSDCGRPTHLRSSEWWVLLHFHFIILLIFSSLNPFSQRAAYWLLMVSSMRWSVYQSTAVFSSAVRHTVYCISLQYFTWSFLWVSCIHRHCHGPGPTSAGLEWVTMPGATVAKCPDGCWLRVESLSISTMYQLAQQLLWQVEVQKKLKSLCSYLTNSQQKIQLKDFPFPDEAPLTSDILLCEHHMYWI